jgi:hypothetical protein
MRPNPIGERRAPAAAGLGSRRAAVRGHDARPRPAGRGGLSGVRPPALSLPSPAPPPSFPANLFSRPGFLLPSPGSLPLAVSLETRVKESRTSVWGPGIFQRPKTTLCARRVRAQRRGWGVQVQGRRRLWGARLARRARPALAATARAFCRACAKYVYLIGSARKWRILLYMFYFRKYC